MTLLMLMTTTHLLHGVIRISSHFLMVFSGTKNLDSAFLGVLASVEADTRTCRPQLREIVPDPYLTRRRCRVGLQ